MDSANLHHHQQHAQLLDHSSSLVTPSSYYGTPSIILNNGNFCQNVQQDSVLVSSLNATSMIQNLGFPHDHLQLSRVKEELSDSYPKFTDLLNSPSSRTEDLHLHPSSYIKNGQRDLNIVKSLISSGCQINDLHLPSVGYFSNVQKYCPSSASIGIPSRGTFSQIYPSINISQFVDQSSSTESNSLNMNLEALDLFNSARFSGSLGQSSHDHLGLLGNSLSCSLDNMQQQLNLRTSDSPTNVPPLNHGVPEVKRSSSFIEPKAPQVTPKKSRVDSRSSFPPIKVRKEKLGDRIAALQQLVAPFGKTDTASVLMEAIGYIKFLQNQVETLSIPYMKSSRNKSSKKMHAGSGEDGQEEPTRDLRIRGLCLVPLSCLSYVTDGDGGVWPPP